MEREKTIKYIGFYDSSTFAEEKRNYSLSATNKMDYIALAIVKAGYNVQIISPSWTKNKSGYYSKRTNNLGDGITLTVGFTFGANNILMRILRISWSWLWLFLYLICNVKKGEKVIAYHSLMIDFPLYCSKLIKGFQLVLEVEEEYCVVIKQPLFFEWLEKKIIYCAEYHLLPTDLMQEAYKHLNKKTIIVYGNYTTQNVFERQKSGVKEIVYAGIIDSIKAGVFNAVRIAKYLDSNFKIKVIGFGDEKDIQMLKNEIEIINETSVCKVYYDGAKSGQEYIDYISNCDVGLSTQKASGEYLLYSFPSKILSYMSVGLRVVSGNIESVKKSKVGRIVKYYDEETPFSIAEAVKSIDFNENYDSFTYLNKLDKEFICNIKELLRS